MGSKRDNLVSLKNGFHRKPITMTNHIISTLSELLQNLPVGTNLALLQFMWMLVSGALLPNRGAIFPALKSIGLSDAETRRAWAAFRKGVWQTALLLRLWQKHVEGLPDWHVHRYEGYIPVSLDVTAFWRPSLKTCPSKHYHPAANRALPAVIFGITSQVGDLNGQRVALPRSFERVHPQDPKEDRLWREMLKSVKKTLAEDEITVLDAGVKIKLLQEIGITRYVVRLAKNFTARRNYLPAYSGRGRRRKYGDVVRPLSRIHNGKTLAATVPDEVVTWLENGREIRAEIWRGLILNKVVPDKENSTFDVYAIYDPKFETPWLLSTSIKLSAAAVKAIYTDRWPVEQIPLAAKQMVGAHRQFVHADESIQRLPELALLAGSILSFLAATVPPAPTGFWDRKPKRTPGRLRRTLIGKPFPKDYQFPGQLRKKNSVTDHLPKGIAARRTKTADNSQTAAYIST
jgi:hypothetical protein